VRCPSYFHIGVADPVSFEISFRLFQFRPALLIVPNFCLRKDKESRFSQIYNSLKRHVSSAKPSKCPPRERFDAGTIDTTCILKKRVYAAKCSKRSAWRCRRRFAKFNLPSWHGGSAKSIFAPYTCLFLLNNKKRTVKDQSNLAINFSTSD
jgi:hypothetical protein